MKKILVVISFFITLVVSAEISENTKIRQVAKIPDSGIDSFYKGKTKIYYYILMNHRTKTTDTITALTKEDLNLKVIDNKEQL